VRRAAAAAAAAAVAVAAWGLWFEPRRIVVRRVRLRLPRWPARLAGLRVAVISDLHTGAPHVKTAAVERVVAKVNAERPDVALLLGDYVDEHVAFGRHVEPEAVAAVLAGLRAAHGVYAVLGNHDWVEGGRRVARALRAAGIVVLENDAAPVADSLWVVGLAAAGRRRVDIDGAFAPVPEGAPAIALTHSPDLFPRLPDRVALTVAGHTHGGQVNLPFLRRRAIPSRYGDRYAAGHVEEDGRHLFVSSGVGTSGYPVRLGRPPEVAVLTLDPG
jgi:predicted MPP superfamily phosphohydrolase